MKRQSLIGTTVNNWLILEYIGNSKSNGSIYSCKCLSCGTICKKTYSQLVRNKTFRCENCKPYYDFKVNGDAATGILPDGTHFTIDVGLMDEFSKYYWHLNSKGYIQRGNRNLPKMMLHWFAFGAERPTSGYIDHINRDKLDNRSTNLRVVTSHQNNLNHGKLSTNKSGFVGVFKNKKNGKWHSKIMLNNKNIHLGDTDNLIEAAQMYNVAASIVFGEFAGHENDVPNPSKEIVSKVYEKLVARLDEAFIVRLPAEILYARLVKER